MAAGNLKGADLEALGDLKTLLERKSSVLDSVVRQVSGAVGTLNRTWDGPDSRQFQQDWAATHRPKLAKATSELQAAAATIERNRQAQEVTSSVDFADDPGASGHRPAGGNSSPGGDRRDLDDPELAGDKVDRTFWFDGFEHDDLTYEFLPENEYGLFGKPGSERSPELTDVDQGSIGDCWFLAGLGAVAHKDSSLIEENIQDNMDGTYTVTFYEKQSDGSFEPVEVTVDGSVPSNESGPAYARPSDDGATWAMIYEKAYADYAGGYDDIEGGSAQDSLELLTGQTIEREDPNDLTDDELVASLSEKPAAIGMINPNDDDPSEQDKKDIANFKSLDLKHSHQYVVQEVFEDPKTGEWMVQLYNPHGPGGLQPGPVTLDEFRSVSDELNTPAA